MTFYTIIIYCLIFFFFAGKTFKRANLNRWTWSGVYSIHVLVGLAFLYVYTFIEGDGVLSQDAGAYFFESNMLYDVFWQSPSDYFQLLFGIGDTEALTEQYLLETNHWDVGSQALSNESRNMIRLHSALHFLSFEMPEIHMLFMALISTATGYFFYRAIESKTELNRYLIIALLCFLPNTLFWSSGLIKEPIYLFGFSLITFALFSEGNGKRIWLSFIGGVIILLLFKFHFLIIVLAGITVWRISKLFRKNKVILTGIVVLAGTTLTLTLFESVRVDLTNSISRKQFDFKNVAQGGLHADTDSCFYYFRNDQIQELNIVRDSVNLKSDMSALRIEYNSTGPFDTVRLEASNNKWKVHFYYPKSDTYFELSPIENTFVKLIGIIPEALLNSFFRPFFSENGGLIKWISILEWITVWALFILSFKWIKSITSNQIELYLFLGTIILLSALLIGWTTPVSGAIVRYRIPMHLGMILIVIMNWKQKTTHNE